MSVDTTKVAFRVDTPAVKAATDEKGTILLNGYANTWTEDRDGETVAKNAFDGTLDAYLAKNPMVLYQHNPDWPIGTVTAGKTDRTGLAVAANIDKPTAGEIPEILTAYRAIQRGTLKTFSIGGFMTKEIKGGKRIISNVDLMEISVVSVPANPESVFEAATKALNGERMTELSPLAKSQMEQLLGFRAITDPELLGMDSDSLNDHFEGLRELFKTVYGTNPPPRDAWARIKGARERGVAVPLIAKASAEVIRSFYKPEAISLEAIQTDTKGGRAISSSNEAKLKKAKAHIDEVLATVAPPKESDLGSDWQDGEPLDSPMNPAKQRMSATARKALSTNGETFRNLETALRAAINEQHPDPDGDGDDGLERYCYVEDFSDSWVVYYHDGQLYQSDYTTSGNDITIGDPKPVRPVTSYVELSIEIDADGAAYVDMGGKGALPVRKLPVAPKGPDKWDEAAALERVKTWSGSEDTPTAKYAQAFLYRDGDGSSFEHYKCLVADVIGGKLQYNPDAVTAAAATVKDGDAISEAIKPKLTSLYSKVASTLEDPSIVAPWADEDLTPA